MNYCFFAENLNITNVLYTQYYNLINVGFNTFSFQKITPCIYKNNCLFSTKNGIINVDINTGLVTNYKIPINYKKSNGSITIDENNIITTMFNGNIYIFNKSNNQLKTVQHNRIILSKSVIYDNCLYFIDISAGLIEFNLETNKFRQFLPKNRNQEVLESIASPLIINNTIIYTATLGQLFFINRDTFEMEYKIILDGKSYENTHLNHLVIDNNYLYITNSRYTYCIDIKERKILWNVEMDSNTELTCYNNSIILSNNYMVYFINKKTGQIEKQFRFPGIITDLIVFKSKLVLMDINNVLYIIDNGSFSYKFNKFDSSNISKFMINNNELFILFMNYSLGEVHLFKIDIKE